MEKGTPKRKSSRWSSRIINRQANRQLLPIRWFTNTQRCRKNEHGGDRKSEESSGNYCHLKKTEQKIAEQYNVSPKTVRRAEKYTKAVDKVSENTGISPQQINKEAGFCLLFVSLTYHYLDWFIYN